MIFNSVRVHPLERCLNMNMFVYVTLKTYITKPISVSIVQSRTILIMTSFA